MSTLEPTADEPRSRRRLLGEALVILAVSLTLNLVGNGKTSLWDRDEPRYAQCTREMRESGNWIHPTFNAEPRYHKPVLIYWLMLGGTAVGGDNPFGARLISSLAGAISCVGVWWFGGKMMGRRIGWLSAVILMTAPIMVIESKLATTDATLALLLLACQFSLWELSKKESKIAATVFWICLALTLLVKGPVGLVLIAVSGLFSWLFGGPRSCWTRLHWRRGLLLFSAITLPWFLAIGVVTKGEFYRVALGFHVIDRMTRGIEQHGGFPGYYLVTTLGTFYPWSAFLPVAILAAWVRRKADQRAGFLLGWIVGPLVFLECVQTKLVHYYLPSIPACAMIVAWVISTLREAEANVRRRTGGRAAMALLAGIGIAAVVAALAGAVVCPWSLRWPCLVVATSLAAGTLFALDAFQSGRASRATSSLAATWGVVLFVVGAWLLPAAEPYRLSKIVAGRLRELSDQEKAAPMLATFAEPSVIYALGRPAAVLRDRDWLHNRVARDGALLAPLSDLELTMLSKDQSLDCEVRESVSGFNLSKGRTETLKLVVIRQSGNQMAKRPSDRAPRR